MRATTPAHRIRLLVTDVDGVWTDGKIVYSGDTREIKEFNVRDGLGVKLAQKSGIAVAVITSRHSRALERRCRELGITEVVQSVQNKVAEMLRIGEKLGIAADEICYIGDDLPDLGPMQAAGMSAAPSDAAAEVLAVATIALQSAGGRGAIRELIEILLRERGVWDAIVREFTSGTIEAPAN